MDSRGGKRSRSRSPPPWSRNPKSPRHDYGHSHSRRDEVPNSGGGRRQESFAQQQSRRNQAQEDAQHREYVSKEGEFVLKQSRKKAQIRVREGRAKPMDWLTVVLSIIDPTRDILEEESMEVETEVMDPEGVLEGLSSNELEDVRHEIDTTFLALETNAANRTYWNAMKIICKDRAARLRPSGPAGRGVRAVTADVDKLLAPKSLEQLVGLESQVNKKLQSNEPIDEDYWEQLLSNIGVYKAKAQLKSIYSSVVASKLRKLRAQQVEEAETAKAAFEPTLSKAGTVDRAVANNTELDPEPLLKVRNEDKAIALLDESVLLGEIDKERARIQKLGYVPMKTGKAQSANVAQTSKATTDNSTAPLSRFAAMPPEDYSQATKALYDREVARGVQEDEEVFTGEEEVATFSKDKWSGQYRPRKPRYFNRVQMGYEWNKYNQTHYDHDNPPPKVVQGYKFNVFYPDLIDKTKAPTYRIERENGRKRGQTFAPAGEEDTCLIRFISGPPYEDLAFRIVDKEWDYSAKYERGFKSSFDKGILQLHFQFKKVYYRK